jgi:hypothetical protein
MGLTLREAHKLRVFENTLLRMLESKKDEDESRRLHNDELHGLYS